MSRKWTVLMEQGSQAAAVRDFAQAAKHFEKALPIIEKSGDVLERFETLTALGSMYAASKQLAQAEQIFSRAVSLAIAAKLGDFACATCICSLGNVYRDLCKYGESRECAEIALKIFQDGDCEHPEMILMPLELLSQLCMREGNYESAVDYLGRAAKVPDEICDDRSLPIKRKLRDKMTEAIEQLQLRYDMKTDTTVRTVG